MQLRYENYLITQTLTEQGYEILYRHRHKPNEYELVTGIASKIDALKVVKEYLDKALEESQ